MAAGYPRKSDRPSVYQYRTDMMLGQGGTGTVYRGLDPDTGEVVAVKLFRANFFRNALHKRDTARMAKKWRKLEHVNVVKIFDFISGPDGDCLVMEYVDGPDLKWYLGNRPYKLNERLVIAAQICNGLGFIHDQGFLHHDLKPANVLFTRKGTVKLSDYSLYGSSIMLALFDKNYSDQITPMYVAPEITKREKSSKASDMYSLGVMFYYLFTGELPFKADNLQKLYLQHLQSRPLPPSMINKECPKSLDDIILRLLEKKPENRWPNCEQLRVAMSEVGKSRI